jgi:hypothetical protein
MLATPAARLLVLVPPGEVPVVDLAERIWTLAAEAGAAVLLVGLARQPEQEPQVRRSLSLLETHTRFGEVPVSTRVARVRDWLAAVKQLRRPGDCVVCFPVQHAAAGAWGLRRQPLVHALRDELRVPAYEVTDVPLPHAGLGERWRATVSLAVSLAIIAAFFVFQAWAQAIPGGMLLVALSVVVEFALLAASHTWQNQG